MLLLVSVNESSKIEAGEFVWVNESAFGLQKKRKKQVLSLH